MKNIVTFVIPVRHQDNAKNWEKIKSNLADTIRSISNQDATGWKAIIVANHGADLPAMPVGFEVKRVDFPPNPLFNMGSAPLEKVYEAVRSDKGRRILAGLLHAGDMGHVMIVDDDDFISRKITSFIAQHPEAHGYYVRDGYVWGDGGALLFKYDANFSDLCGTSHIIRADLYDLPTSFDVANEEYIQKMLGSHKFIRNYLREKNTPLESLPFVGAVYRVGHSENHSRANDMLSTYFFQRWLWRNPIKQIKRLMRLRKLNKNLSNEFFGLQ